MVSYGFNTDAFIETEADGVVKCINPKESGMIPCMYIYQDEEYGRDFVNIIRKWAKEGVISPMYAHVILTVVKAEH